MVADIAPPDLAKPAGAICAISSARPDPVPRSAMFTNNKVDGLGLRKVQPLGSILDKSEDPTMLRILTRVSIGVTLLALFGAPAKATQNCLKDNQPYKLAGDTIAWSMTIVPGADCIQGLRWSTMQIYSVSVAEKPKSGDLILVGPGFRYFAKPDFTGTDNFILVVVGKNRHDKGSSTVQITVSGRQNSFAVSSN